MPAEAPEVPGLAGCRLASIGPHLMSFKACNIAAVVGFMPVFFGFLAFFPMP